MKIVFFGSSEFAVPSLERLLESSHEVQAVVTQPDREKGRHLNVQGTPVKEIALKKRLKIFQPENLKGPEIRESLSSLSADLFVVAAFGQILPGDILKIPKLYSINLHASLLPKYRGASPINRAIVKGEKKTGLTVIRMNEKMDAGDIMLKRSVEIEAEDTSGSLGLRLSQLGAILLLDAIRFITEDRINFKKQNEKQASFAPPLKKEDGLIDWQKSADEINNMVRGFLPWPSAYTFLNNKVLKIRKSAAAPYYHKPEPGKIVDIQKGSFSVVCAKDALLVSELQLEGGKRMDAASFLRGHKLEAGTFLGKTSPFTGDQHTAL